MTANFGLTIIGERINPGFKSTKGLFDNSDIEGIQALAIKQVEAGARYLNVNIGARALTDVNFMVEVVKGIQEVTDHPLSFDFPGLEVQKLCMEAYDIEKANGKLPIVNSITEHRWDLMELAKDHKFRVILMASERVEDGVAKGNKTADEMYSTARRSALRLCDDYGMTMDDVILDMSVSAIIADMESLNRNTLDAIRLVGEDGDLKGVHMMGGLSNIGQQLPVNAVDGSNLKHSLECAFLTIAVPYGFDTILGTPWREYHPLSENNYVLQRYREFLKTTGSNSLRAVRKFYKA